MFLRKLTCVCLTGWALVAVGPAIALAAEEADERAHMAHEVEEEVSDSPNPLAFDPDLALFTGIVFILLVIVLGKFAWPQIAAAMDEREQKIADDIAAAAAKHEEAKRLLAEHEAKLAAAAGEVRELLEEARRDAEATKTRIANEARQAAEEEKVRVLREIDRAKDGALHELAEVSANVAIDLTRRAVAQELSADRQNQILRDAMNLMSNAEPSKN